MGAGNVLMVCLGNICRSPLAQGIFENLLTDTSIIVDSAGTANFHSGAAPDPRSIATAKAHGIDIAQQKARQFVRDDFEAFDHIFVMDKQNLHNVLSLAQTTAEKNKVRLLLDPEEVEDPYYGGPEGFEIVFKKIHTACTKILEEWK